MTSSNELSAIGIDGSRSVYARNADGTWPTVATRVEQRSTHLAEYIEQLGKPETKAAAIAERNSWVETAMQFSNGESYYRDLLDQIAVNFGEDAFLADDGSNVGSVVRARLPELVAAKLASLATPVTSA